MVAALVLLGLDVLGTPAFFHQAQMTCVGSHCANNQITPAQLPDLLASGLSADFYAIYIVVLYWSGTLVYAAIAAAIFWRRSDDRAALFGAFALLTFGAGTVFGTLNALPESNGTWSLAVHLTTLVGVLAFYVFFCLFPSGHFVPRWIRWAVLLEVSREVSAVIPYAPLQTIAGGPISFFVLFGLLVFAQVYRYRRVSTSVQRQQTKWVVLGFALGFGGFLVVLGLSNLAFGSGSPGATLATIFFSGAQAMLLCLVPIFIAIAILRSRLWDIDVLINRALVYGSLTALLAAVYAGLIVGLESLGGAITGKAGQQPVALVISTLATFALFNPLRGRIQGFIDRRFYRRKYDVEKTLTAFGVTLRQEVELNELRTHLLAAVEETMQPAHVSLWLRPADRLAAPVPAMGQREGLP
jgi:hypothetical protein